MNNAASDKRKSNFTVGVQHRAYYTRESKFQLWVSKNQTCFEYDAIWIYFLRVFNIQNFSLLVEKPSDNLFKKNEFAISKSSTELFREKLINL